MNSLINTCSFFFSDLDFVTFNLPVASNFNHASETDISPVTEEFANGSADMLSIEPFHCAEQLTAMDAVST